MTAPVKNLTTLTIALPLSKDFVQALLHAAVRGGGLGNWGRMAGHLPDEHTYLVDEHEWSTTAEQGQFIPPSHRIDLYTIVRGIEKIFEPGRDVPIATRQHLLRLIYENAREDVMRMTPSLLQLILQLALFDQEVY